MAGVVLRLHQIARGSRTIARDPGQIASLSGRVALLSALQARAGGQLALVRRAPSDATTGLVLIGVDAVGEVSIARGLIAVRRVLVAVGAGLIALAAGLIGIAERLVAVGERLLGVGERLLVTRSIRSVRRAHMASVALRSGGPVGSV